MTGDITAGDTFACCAGGVVYPRPPGGGSRAAAAMSGRSVGHRFAVAAWARNECLVFVRLGAQTGRVSRR
ncbi:hypothetical protein ACPMJQ_28700 [Streptomyces pseudogriseolus]|uniref:hypothetical protein n=1 Tax=Streptomyces pseudogriseolus TaxID=36817 RepID=UPI003FA27A0C